MSQSSSRHILIYRLGSLGDGLVALPTLRTVRQRFPQARITLLTNPPVSDRAAPLEEVLRAEAIADAYLHHSIPLRDQREIVKLARHIRQGAFTDIITLAPERGTTALWRDALFFKCCAPGARLHGFRAAMRAYAPEVPEARRLADRVASLAPVELDQPALWQLHYTDEERQKARASLGPNGRAPVLAFSIGTKWAVNQWGQARWESLFAQLAPDCADLTLCALGAPAEHAASQAILRQWRGPTVNVCGQLTVRQSGALLAQSALFIGHDSGPLHLASASHIPLIGIYSAKNPPGHWFPPLWRGGRLFYPEGPDRAIGSTLPEAVAAETRHLLAQP